MYIRRAALTLALMLSVSACSSGDKASSQSHTDNPLAGQTMVAAADPRAVDAGLEALAKGGNAVDAAIAVQSVLSLVEPQSSGLAGGAFLIYYDAGDKTVTMYDGREMAPASATPKLFYGDDDKRLPFVQGLASGRSTGVPGAVAMLDMAHKDHGKLPWADGFDAAYTLADKGFIVSPRLESMLKRSARFGLLNKQAAARDYFFPVDGETPLAQGDRRTNPQYAAALLEIQKGAENFYSGTIAQSIIAATRAAPRPGGMTLADFSAYKPRKREALCSDYRDYQICGAQPPSSGGVAVQSILRTLEPLNMAAHGPDSVLGWHYFIEGSRLAYADRDKYVGDDKFVDVPINPMLDADYLATRTALISPDRAISKVTAGDPAGFVRGQDMTPDSPGTSHMSIVDGQGNVVSMTTTVESAFGSQRMAMGMMLNNQLTDFSFVPVDDKGAPVANAVAPGKRPRSSMSPTIVLDDDGKFVLATGSPGGNSIIAYTAKTLVGMLDWGLTPQEAADLPNVIARGSRVKMETEGMPEDVIAALTAMGHNLALSDGEISGIHIVRVAPDGRGYIGAADKRREGVARTIIAPLNPGGKTD